MSVTRLRFRMKQNRRVAESRILKSQSKTLQWEWMFPFSENEQMNEKIKMEWLCEILEQVETIRLLVCLTVVRSNNFCHNSHKVPSPQSEGLIIKTGVH